MLDLSPKSKPPPTLTDPVRCPPTVRPLALSELESALRIFTNDSDWTVFAQKFEGHARWILTRPISTDPPPTLLGCLLADGTLVGVGAAFKEPFDFHYWSLSWIIVDQAYRGRGYGQKIVDSLLTHCREEQSKTEHPACRVLISVVDDGRYYEKRWGFNAIHRGPLLGESLMSLDLTGPDGKRCEPKAYVDPGC